MNNYPNFKPELCPYYSQCTAANDSELCHVGCNSGRLSYDIIMSNSWNMPKQWRNIVNTRLQPGEDLEQYKHLSSIQNDIENWIKEGKNLYIYSDTPGNGKTSWAIKLGFTALFHLTKKCYDIDFFNPQPRVIFLNVEDFLFKKKEAIHNKALNKEVSKLIEYITNAELVIWDDIGTSQLSDYDYKLIYAMINNREGKSNIFTSNVIDESLIANVGNRLASRIQDTSDIVEFINPSQRRPE